jgi:hypothetical protein
MRPSFALLIGLLAAFALAGCDDTTAPRDVTPPAAPRALYSTSGNAAATLRWIENTESDLAGYRIYQAPCASGQNCPYDRVGVTTATQFTVTGLTNGVTRWFAVSAVDRSGNESPLSTADVFDTPRPSGSATLNNFVQTTAGAGWDFSAASPRASNDLATDMIFGYNGNVYQMFTPDLGTNIQDAGYATSLDAVDYAPNTGWSGTGTAELIPGHCYIVWTRDDHYAKFRVTGLSSSLVSFDWAYQTAPGNPELRARPGRETPAPRPVAWLR